MAGSGVGCGSGPALGFEWQDAGLLPEGMALRETARSLKRGAPGDPVEDMRVGHLRPQVRARWAPGWLRLRLPWGVCSNAGVDLACVVCERRPVSGQRVAGCPAHGPVGRATDKWARGTRLDGTAMWLVTTEPRVRGRLHPPDPRVAALRAPGANLRCPGRAEQECGRGAVGLCPWE